MTNSRPFPQREEKVVPLPGGERKWVSLSPFAGEG